MSHELKPITDVQRWSQGHNLQAQGQGRGAKPKLKDWTYKVMDEKRMSNGKVQQHYRPILYQ